VVDDAKCFSELIYDFPAIPTDADRNVCSLPTLSLAHTCRQLRTEYLPIFKTAPATVPWSKLASYLSTFYSNANGTLAHIAQAPRSLTIFVGYNHPKEDGIINLLPLFIFQHANAGFLCDFGRHAEQLDGTSSEALNLRKFLKDDGEMLCALLRHDDSQWLDDINSGRIGNILINAVGQGMPPTVSIFVDDEVVKNLSEQHENEEAKFDYSKRIGLRSPEGAMVGGDYMYRAEVQYIAMR